jgi:hypothetical protein
MCLALQKSLESDKREREFACALNGTAVQLASRRASIGAFYRHPLLGNPLRIPQNPQQSPRRMVCCNTEIIVFPSSGIHDEGDCLHFSTQIQMLTQAEKLKHTKADASRASTPVAAKRPRGSNGLHPVTH